MTCQYNFLSNLSQTDKLALYNISFRHLEAFLDEALLITPFSVEVGIHDRVILAVVSLYHDEAVIINLDRYFTCDSVGLTPDDARAIMCEMMDAIDGFMDNAGIAIGVKR